MRSRTQKLKQKELNIEQWQKLYYQNQQSYLRTRLLAIKFLAEGKTRTEVTKLANCTYKTFKIMIQVIEQKWNVHLKDSRIYEIIGELNLSYQKGHRDYANADKNKQKQFIELLKKTAP